MELKNVGQTRRGLESFVCIMGLISWDETKGIIRWFIYILWSSVVAAHERGIKVNIQCRKKLYTKRAFKLSD